MTRCATAALAALAWATHAAGAQLVVTQMELFFTPDSGRLSTATFTVTNGADHPVQATLAIEDWDRTDRGDNVFRPLGASPASCHDRLSVFPEGLFLAPKEVQTVRVRYAGAEPEDPGCWGVVFVETVPPASPQAGRAIMYVLRTGVKVYVQPRHATRDGTIDAMTVQPHMHDPTGAVPDTVARDLVVSFRNTGSGQIIDGAGTVELRRPDNSLAATLRVPHYWVTPGARRVLTLGLPHLEPGTYVALALLDFGGPEVAAGQLALHGP